MENLKAYLEVKVGNQDQEGNSRLLDILLDIQESIVHLVDSSGQERLRTIALQSIIERLNKTKSDAVQS